MPPTLANGKICYIEMPAINVEQSAAFYAKCFGWSIRTRGDGAKAFDDTTGQVSGSFVVGRKTWDAPGILFYIMVDSVAGACQAVEAQGGKVVQPIGADAPEITARFRDPAGNIVGLYQEPSRGGQT
jgi:predicted enzyme related to lactoylglutathione lyase